MKKWLASGILAVVVSGCTTPVPDSGRGVGFGTAEDFARLQAERDAALQGNGAATFGPPAAVQTQAIPSTDLAAAGIGSTTPTNTAPLSALDPNRTTAPAPVPSTNNPGISDEQDFDAVAGRESIESDAQRRAQQAAARQVIQPTAIPDRPSTAGPNIVEYALNAPNRKGQEWWSRSFFSGQNRFQRNCAEYNNADAAQRDFLARGGPQRDPRGLDPDGDGFACGWDPAPFLRAAGR